MTTQPEKPKLVLIEDEPDIAYLEQLLLTDDFEVIAFITEQEIKCVKDYLGWPETKAVIVDLTLPNIDGSELLAWLKQEHPDVRRIAVSASILTLSNLPDGLADVLLSKPYSISTLNEVARD